MTRLSRTPSSGATRGRAGGRERVLPDRRGEIREEVDDRHLKQAPLQMGRGVPGPGHLQRDHRQARPPRHDRQDQRQVLQA